MRQQLSKRVLSVPFFTARPRGGAANPTPENMNWNTWQSAVWAREDTDIKLDGSTLADNFRLPRFNRLGKKPGDPVHYHEPQLDGWQHKVDLNYNVGWSRLRIPGPVDPVNWRPVTTAEEDLFHKRREHAAKTRRKFWNWRYNPKTEGYFSEAWSDRRVTQQDWSNSQWFRMTSNQYWNSSYWLMANTCRFLMIMWALYEYNRWHQHNSKYGRPYAPATDGANWEIEVIDMDRGNYTPIGSFAQGQYTPFTPESS